MYFSVNTSYKVYMISQIMREESSRLFTMLFSEKKEALELYNALTKRQYTNYDGFTIAILGNVVCLSMKNDVSLMIDARNTLRDLKKLFSLLLSVNSEKKTNLKSITFPLPSCVVMYYGRDDIPDYQAEVLSDSLAMGDESISIETKVHILNMNSGHNQELIKACKTLQDYMEYVDRVRKYQERMSIDEAVEKAIDECIQDNILTHFLCEHRAVVKTMSIDEFDQKKLLEMEKYAIYQDGIEEGKREGARNMLRELVAKKLVQGIFIEEISEILEISISKVCALVEEIYEVEEENI